MYARIHTHTYTHKPSNAPNTPNKQKHVHRLGGGGRESHAYQSNLFTVIFRCWQKDYRLLSVAQRRNQKQLSIIQDPIQVTGTSSTFDPNNRLSQAFDEDSLTDGAASGVHYSLTFASCHTPGLPHQSQNQSTPESQYG